MGGERVAEKVMYRRFGWRSRDEGEAEGWGGGGGKGCRKDDILYTVHE